MAAELVGFYEKVNRELGAIGRMKLAMLTRVSSVQAEKEPDSPANIKKFTDAIAQLKTELKG